MKQMFAVKQELVIPAGYEAPSPVSLEVALEEALSCMRKAHLVHLKICNKQITLLVIYFSNRPNLP